MLFVNGQRLELYQLPLPEWQLMYWVITLQPMGSCVRQWDTIYFLRFEDYLFQNNIVHYGSPPYHPSTNGLAENMENIKHHLKKHKHANISRCVSDFVRVYHNTPHTSTNRLAHPILVVQAPINNCHWCLSEGEAPTLEQTLSKICKF